MRLSRAEPPRDAPEHSGCNDHRTSLGLRIMARLIRDQSVLLSVALAATLWSSAALSQAETETEIAPSQPVETVPTAPPAPPRPVSDEPSAPTPPVVAPNTASSSETAPAPLPTGAPTTGPLVWSLILTGPDRAYLAVKISGAAVRRGVRPPSAMRPSV